MRAEVDFKAHWADPTVQKFASAITGSASAPPVAPVSSLGGSAAASTIPPEIYQQIALKALDSLQHAINPVVLENGSIPKTADGKLLWMGRREMSRDLSDLEKRALRKSFKQLL